MDLSVISDEVYTEHGSIYIIECLNLTLFNLVGNEGNQEMKSMFIGTLPLVLMRGGKLDIKQPDSFL